MAHAARAIVATNRQAVSVDARDSLPPPGIVEASLFDAVFFLFDLQPFQGPPCDSGSLATIPSYLRDTASSHALKPRAAGLEPIGLGIRARCERAARVAVVLV